MVPILGEQREGDLLSLWRFEARTLTTTENEKVFFCPLSYFSWRFVSISLS